MNQDFVRRLRSRWRAMVGRDAPPPRESQEQRLARYRVQYKKRRKGEY